MRSTKIVCFESLLNRKAPPPRTGICFFVPNRRSLVGVTSPMTDCSTGLGSPHRVATMSRSVGSPGPAVGTLALAHWHAGWVRATFAAFPRAGRGECGSVLSVGGGEQTIRKRVPPRGLRRSAELSARIVWFVLYRPHP